MKVLLDSCIWGNPKSVIAAGGHEVEWVGDWSVDRGDEQILAQAAADRRALVTVEQARVRIRPADQRSG